MRRRPAETKTLQRLFAAHRGKVSDKWRTYLAEYERILAEYRPEPVRLLEIGVQNGGSLEIWSKYFSRARILIGCDVDPRCARLSYGDPRIAVVIGDANTDEVQDEILRRSSGFDIVIDDGSHRSADVVRSFARYFPLVANGGVYVVEDLHCSYWREYGGGLYHPHSPMALFKRLADAINHEHWGLERSRAEFLRGLFHQHGVRMPEEALESLHSLYLSNSLCAVRKDRPERNRLNGRVVAGSVEDVQPGLLPLRSRPSVATDQTANEWTARELPPDEELPLRLHELSDRDRRIVELDREASERRGEIAGLQYTIQAAQDRLVQLASTVAQREADLSRRREELASREASLAELEGTLAAERETRRELGATLASREASLAELEGTLSAERETRRELGATLASREASLAELEGTLSAERETRRELEAKSAHIDRVLAAERGRRLQLESALASRGAELEGRVVELNASRGEGNALRQKVSALEAQVREIHASTSWRVTGSLRLARVAQRQLLQAVRRILSRTARAVYHGWTPLPPRLRVRIKHALFSTAAPLFRHTVAYRDWKAQRDPRRSDDAPQKPGEDPKPAVAAVRNESPVPNTDLALVTASEYFDETWYVTRYPEVSGVSTSPVVHYLQTGWRLGYDPGPRFSTRSYLAYNRDVKAVQSNPLVHFLRFGRREGRPAALPPRPTVLPYPRFSPVEYGPISTFLKYDDECEPPPGMANRVCVQLHLFHTPLADEFANVLNRLRVPFALFVSVREGESESDWKAFFQERVPRATRVLVRAVPNRGRDVLSWLVTFAGDIRDYDVLCHLHTKRSSHNPALTSWRRFLIHTIFGSDSTVNQILTAFSSDARLGLVFPAYFHTLTTRPNWAHNRSKVEDLFGRMTGRPLPDECPDFPAGSFFWARVSLLAPLFDLRLKAEDFDAESGQIDGTLAHAIERVVGLLPELRGMSGRCVSVDVAFDLIHYIDKHRPAKPASLPRKTSDALKRVPRRRPQVPRRIAVFTAITGGYEELTPPFEVEEGVDYFAFCDDPEADVPAPYKVVPCNYIGHAPVRTARYVKTHPHFWFPEHDFACWIDANVLAAGSLTEYVSRVEEAGVEAGFVQHPVRSTWLDEARECRTLSLDDVEAIDAQIREYERLPELVGVPLIETGFFVCKPHSPGVRQFMKVWWREINSFSHRDQISAVRAVAESGLAWIPLFAENRSVRDHEDFYLFAHRFKGRMAFRSWLRQSEGGDPEGPGKGHVA